MHKIHPLYNNVIFNSVTVLYSYEKDKRIWSHCKCDCGKEFEARLDSIRDGNTKSCSHFQIETARKICKENSQTHGQSENNYFYNLWINIKQRCLNPNNKRYKDYGGRGVTIFQPWINDFVKFEIDVINEIGHKPFKHLSLDRINNNGNYEPGNIQWNDFVGQNNNRR